MRFEDRYTTDSNDKDKKLISADAYAVGEMINELIKELKRDGRSRYPMH